MSALEDEHYPDWRDRIEQVPDLLAGKPVVKGTRISVELITGPAGRRSY